MNTRCSEHDLALDPSGQCVLCRRAERPRPALGAWSTLKIVLGILLVALGSATAYRAFRRAEPLLQRPAPAPPTPEPIETPLAETPVVPAPRPRPRRPAQAAVEPQQTPPSTISPARREEPDRYALIAARRRVRIAMYSTTWCGSCQRARAYMTAEGIAFVEHDVEQDARAAQRMRTLNPRGGVPTFDIDGTIRVGFGPRNLEMAINAAARRHL